MGGRKSGYAPPRALFLTWKQRSNAAAAPRLLLFENRPNDYLFSILFSLVTRSHDWLPTVQLVLQADWQVLLHSPQPVTFLS